MRQTINRLRKGLADINILEEKEESVRIIKRYEKQYKDLTIVEIDESENEDEEMEDTHLHRNKKMENETETETIEEDSDMEDMVEPHINGVKIDWNDMIILNQVLKEYRIQASKKILPKKRKVILTHSQNTIA